MTFKQTNAQVKYLSHEGLLTLQAELKTLEQEYADQHAKLVDLRQTKEADQFDVIEDIHKLNSIEAEIDLIKNTIANSKIIETDPSAHTIQIGSKVKLEYRGHEMECTVVSPIEADPSEGRISDQSPLGRALLGQLPNSMVEVITPHSKYFCRILGLET